MMTAIHCISCQSPDVIKAGKQPNGAQRYRCQNLHCDRTIFLLDYSAKGRLPEMKYRIIEMLQQGKGVRETARALGVSTDIVTKERKKYGIRLGSADHLQALQCQSAL